MAAEVQDEGFRVSRRKVILGSIVGVILATNAGVSAWERGSVEYKKGKSEPLELRFAGPFSAGQAVLVDKKENAWVKVSKVGFSDEYFNNFEVVWGFNGKVTPSQKIHVTITATAIDGKTYTLVDSDRTDVRLTPPRIVGTVMTSAGSIFRDGYELPRKASEISKITACFVPISSDPDR